MCARPAVPASVYKNSGRAQFPWDHGRPCVHVCGILQNQDQNRVADASSMRGMSGSDQPTSRHDRLAGRHREEGPSRRLAAAVAPRLEPGWACRWFPGAGGGNRSCAGPVRPGSAHGTNQSHRSSVHPRGPVHGRFVNAKFDRAGIQDPAAGAARGGDIGSEKISTSVRGS